MKQDKPLKIQIEINGKIISVDIEEAKRIQKQLNDLFGEQKKYVPYIPNPTDDEQEPYIPPKERQPWRAYPKRPYEVSCSN